MSAIYSINITAHIFFAYSFFMLSFLGFTVENNKHHAVLFCVGEEGGLVEDTAVVMEEWGRLGVGAGGPQARRRPLAEALRLPRGRRARGDDPRRRL